jgi:hypothetical protein
MIETRDDDDEGSTQHAEELLRDELYGSSSDRLATSSVFTQLQEDQMQPPSPGSTDYDNYVPNVFTQHQQTEPRDAFMYEEREQDTPVRCKQPSLSQHDENSAMMHDEDEEEMESSVCSPQPAMTQKVINNTKFSQNEEELDSPECPKLQPISWRPASFDKSSDQQYTRLALKVPENEGTATLDEDIERFCASRSTQKPSSIASQTSREGENKVCLVLCRSFADECCYVVFESVF